MLHTLPSNGCFGTVNLGLQDFVKASDKTDKERELTTSELFIELADDPYCREVANPGGKP